MIRFLFCLARNIWLTFMCAWLLVLFLHAAGCSTKPATRKASAELQKRTFGSGAKRPTAPPVRQE